MIKDNINEVRNNIKLACERVGRDFNEVTLISVTKTKPVADLVEAYDAGERQFGENKVQEIMDKYDQLPNDVIWHMIGHLQRNKVKYIVDKVALIHSVDSYRLAEAISQEAIKKDCQVNILIEVNVAEEESKFGIRTDETISLVKNISMLPNIHIKGLMTIAPYVENPEDNRNVFKALKKLSVDIDNQNIDNISMDVLSMGMTNDYMVAVEEGATMVRVGTGIFGARSYNI